MLRTLKRFASSETQAAVEIWENSPQTATKSNIKFNHPLYTPNPSPSTGFPQIKQPLHFPSFEESRHRQSLVISGPATYRDVPWDLNEAPIGQYPKIQQQYAILRDPFAYWDKQGRRNYGEILYDHDNMTDIWGIGPEQDAKYARSALFKTAAYFLGIFGLVYLWDPASRVYWAPADFPFDGLRVQLGHNPKDPTDRAVAARTYEA